MTKACEITGKTSRASARRSHSNIQTKTLQKANLQKKRIDGKVMLVCTRALKTMKKKAKQA